MFGIGVQELIIILVIGIFVIGVPVAILILLVMLIRKQRSADKSPTYSELITENHRLQAEIADLRNKHD